MCVLLKSNKFIFFLEHSPKVTVKFTVEDTRYANMIEKLRIYLHLEYKIT